MIDYSNFPKPSICLVGYGFEDRTLALISNFEKVSIKEKYLFEYTFCFGDVSSDLGKTEKWQRNKFKIDKFFSKCSKKYIHVQTSIRNPLETNFYLQNIFKENRINFSEFHILIDITSFPKVTLLTVFSEIIKKDSKGTILYFEPQNYELPFSIGAKYYGLLPQFGNKYNPNRKRILILILGFEGDRALSVWNNCEPDETIALIGDPFYKNIEWKKIAEEENKLILNSQNVRKDYISFVDPFKIIQKLEEIYENNKNENIIIAPLGTKFSTIPIAYFIRNKSNIFVAFSSAEREAEHQTIGFETSIICDFTNSEITKVTRD